MKVYLRTEVSSARKRMGKCEQNMHKRNRMQFTMIGTYVQLYYHVRFNFPFENRVVGQFTSKLIWIDVNGRGRVVGECGRDGDASNAAPVLLAAG